MLLTNFSDGGCQCVSYHQSIRTSEAPISEQNGSIGAECQRLGYNRRASTCSRSMDIKNKIEADRHNDGLDPAGRAQLSHRVLKMKVHRILADL